MTTVDIVLLLLILLGAFRSDPKLAAFAATGVILSATYMLWMFQRVNYGPVTNEKNAALPDLQQREWVVIAPIIAVSILMGVLSIAMSLPGGVLWLLYPQTGGPGTAKQP